MVATMIPMLALSREIWDHTPLLLDTGEKGVGKDKNSFKFELDWLMKDDFFELVSDVWHKENK
jgi:hypothetical protein